MKWITSITGAVALVLLTGCAADQICRIRSLSGVTEPSDRSAWSGSFPGIEKALASSNTGNINILFVHGMGWTQQVGDKQFGFDLAEVLAQRLKADPKWRMEKDLCPRSTLGLGTKAAVPAAMSEIAGGVMLTSATAAWFKTDDPEMMVGISDLGCLDRLQLVLPDKRTVSIYRFFWDDALWDSVEWPHMGYDDPVGRGLDGEKVNNVGYDDVDELRVQGNSDLKNNVMTWGLIDAAAYLGPAGRFAREGVGAALCAVASGNRDYKAGTRTQERRAPDGHLLRNVRVITSTAACNGPSEKMEPMLVLTHSLGSRVVFDVLTRDLDVEVKGVAARVNSLPDDGLTVYMLANQIPLVGVGRITKFPQTGACCGITGSANALEDKKASLTRRPRFVAFSEVNDLMTYELVPYFEHMAYLRERDRYDERRTKLLRTKEARDEWVQTLGFDVIDVRVSFLGAIPILNLARPDQAHTGLLTNSKQVPALLLDGVSNGVPLSPGVGKGDCKVQPRTPSS